MYLRHLASTFGNAVLGKIDLFKRVQLRRVAFRQWTYLSKVRWPKENFY